MHGVRLLLGCGRGIGTGPVSVLDDAVGTELDDAADVFTVAVDIVGELAVVALVELDHFVGGLWDAEALRGGGGQNS